VASIEQLIRKSINPFDPTTFKPGNFWQESQNQAYEVTSIHQHVVDSVELALTQVMGDRKTRTLMLLGDSGSGKSHLLGRIKKRLNDQACFAYIGPWPDSQSVWRHVLRHTVDSLMAVPAGQKESQLVRWLKKLEIFNRNGFAKRMMGERRAFIHDMRASFPTVRNQAKDFFSAIYALLDPKLSLIATDWLRGEDLDEEDMQLIKVKRSINSEDAAQKMMSNLGWLADSTQPIVLCFDNLDNVPNMPNGQTGLKAMFNVNTMIHNEKLKNFLVVISLITSNWNENKGEIEYANLARIDQQLTLPKITIEQAADLWASRLGPLHSKARPKPDSPIAPLTKAWLEHKYPGGRLLPRLALMSAEQLIKEFKQTGKMPGIPTGDNSVLPIPKPAVDPLDESDRASFELTWQKEFQTTGEQLRRIAQFSSPELIRRLQEVLEALQMQTIQNGVLPSDKYSSYSLGYESSGQRAGVIWTEDGNMTSFCYVMRACQKMIKGRSRDHIYLIRKEKVGTPKNKGYQLYEGMFSAKQNTHLTPTLASVQYLETYHRLVNAAAGGELVIGRKTPNVRALQALARESGILAQCALLQDLGVVEGGPVIVPPPNPDPVDPLPDAVAAAERYILNLMTTQSLVGMQIMVETTQEQVPVLEESDIVNVIQSLCNENRVQMIDPNAKLEDQLLCYVPA